MKNILIATTNDDKYKVVKYLLQKAGLDGDSYKYYDLKEINYQAKDNKEYGSIEERSHIKAISTMNNLKDNMFEYIVGVDDGIKINGVLHPNVKDFISKILYQGYLENGEEFAFYRSYSIIDKNGKEFKTVTHTTYTYKEKRNVELKQFSYPLSQVSVPLNYNVSISDLSDEEANKYNWENAKEKLSEIVKNMIRKI